MVLAAALPVGVSSRSHRYAAGKPSRLMAKAAATISASGVGADAHHWRLGTRRWPFVKQLVGGAVGKVCNGRQEGINGVAAISNATSKPIRHWAPYAANHPITPSAPCGQLRRK